MADELPGRLADGFPGDRRIRPAQFVQLDITVTTRNVINIWLPEGIHEAKGRCRYFVPGEVRTLRWERTERDGVCCTGDVDGVVRFTGTVDEFEFGAALSLTIENTTDQRLDGVSADPCVQLATAPDFVDLERRRTWWRKGGEWCPFPDPKPVEGGAACSSARPTRRTS